MVDVNIPTSVARRTPELAICSANSRMATGLAPGSGGSTDPCQNATMTFGIVEVKGCFTVATKREDVPAEERPVWDEFEKTKAANRAFCLGLSAHNQKIDSAICDLSSYMGSSLFVSKGVVSVNGIKFTPGRSSAIVVAPYLERVVSHLAKAQFGKMTVAPPPSFSSSFGQIDMDLHGESPPQWLTGKSPSTLAKSILSFDGKEDLPDIGGFKLDGQVDLAFVREQARRYSEGRVRLALPADAFKAFNGQPPNGEVRLTGRQRRRPRSQRARLRYSVCGDAAGHAQRRALQVPRPTASPARRSTATAISGS